MSRHVQIKIVVIIVITVTYYVVKYLITYAINFLRKQKVEASTSTRKVARSVLGTGNEWVVLSDIIISTQLVVPRDIAITSFRPDFVMTIRTIVTVILTCSWEENG